MEETKQEESGTATPYRAALAAVGLVPSGQENVAFSGFVPQTADELQATIESLRAQIIRTATKSARRKAAIGQLNHGLACWKRLAESAQRLKGQYAEKHAEQAERIAALEQTLSEKSEIDRQIREVIWLGEPGSILDAVKMLWANLQKAQERVKELEADHKEPLGTYAALRAELEGVKAERDGLQKRNDIQAGQLKHIDGEISPLMSEVSALKVELAASKARVAELEAAGEWADEPEWKNKVKAAHDMVSALCKPRGSHGAREWIMSIPANEAYDPDLVITDGLMAAEKRIKYLESQPPAPIASPDVMEQLAELMADEMGEPTITRTPHGMQRRMKAVAAILRAAQAHVDLPNYNMIVYHCGQTQIHGNEIEALNSRIRYRVALPETPMPIPNIGIDWKPAPGLDGAA